MNENKKSFTTVWVLILIFIIFSVVLAVKLATQKEKIIVAPRAEESTNATLSFLVADAERPDRNQEVALAPGRKFALLIMLSNANRLEQNKKYKFHLKFDYDGTVVRLNKPYTGELNEDERGNVNIVSMDSIFDEINIDEVKKTIPDDESIRDWARTMEIKGHFKADDYTLAKNNSVVVFALSQFEVREDVDNSKIAKFFWYKDEDQIDDLKPGKSNRQIQIGSETAVVPDTGSDTTKPLGEIKAEPMIVIPGQTSQIPQTTGAVTLNLSLKFQGILKKPDTQYNSMPVKISIAGGSSASPISSQTGTFTANDAGVWSGSMTFPAITTGSNYRILVKGPKHLQKRICDTNPSETYPGSYTCSDGKISLQAGVNTFDFSKVYQLAGDLPEQNGVQNGFTNSYDTSLIRNNLNSADPTILKFADLNLDGIVNTQDFSLAIAALEFRSDEQ